MGWVRDEGRAQSRGVRASTQKGFPGCQLSIHGPGPSWGGEGTGQLSSLGNIWGPGRLAGWPSAPPETGSRASTEDRTAKARARRSWKEPVVADILELAPRMIHRGRQTSWPPAAGKKGLCGRGQARGPAAPQQLSSGLRHGVLSKVGPPSRWSRTRDAPRLLPRGPLALPRFPESLSKARLFKIQGISDKPWKIN